MHYMKCDINLCIHCYKLFHTEPNLVQIKELLKQAYNRDHTTSIRKINVIYINPLLSTTFKHKQTVINILL